MRLLSSVMKAFVKVGYLKLFDAEGVEHEFGTPGTKPEVAIRLHDKRLHWTLAVHAELAFPEAYMDGTLTLEPDYTIGDLMQLYIRNQNALSDHPLQALFGVKEWLMRRVHQFNPLSRASKNAQHHYDLSEELYRTFLDENMQYSCAYWLDPEHETLDQAQVNKLQHIASKLQLEPGMHVLDIGSGWGGLGIFLARQFGVRVTGINVAVDQLATSQRRAQEAGVADRVSFIEKDYRLMEGEFDRIVSVGMMEHVGISYFDKYFDTIKRLLKPDGVAMVHAIGSQNGPTTTAAFINKYIFPGSYAPALSEVLASTERTNMWVCDVEVLRRHYAYTLSHWHDRFQQNRERIAEMYDERFCRMWELYLRSVEAGFESGRLMVFQIILGKDRLAAPIVRDYITDRDREQREAFQQAAQ